MRPLHLMVSVVALTVLMLAIYAGRMLAPIPAAVEAPPASAAAPLPTASEASRGVEPAEGTSGLVREDARKPLSELSLALPPKPKMPAGGATLFQPVATAAGVVEAKGYRVAIADVEVLPADATCSASGRMWACGVRARSAFRSWLGGRALTCDLPPEGGGEMVAAPCRMGKQDAGAWLVANGWAKAKASGPYAEAGVAAQKAGKGIFGPAPDLSLPRALSAADPKTSVGQTEPLQ